ncbi:MAG: DUF1501 domain-containing protein, partial [Myxococcales bacterium]|nr:DUF1501 domain-containing protein [Myxococcales bacterium]
MRRRTFLTAGGAGAAAVLIGPWIRRSSAASFGEFPAGTTSVQLPDGQKAKKVLEVFLYGGLSAWETLYFVRDYGTPSDPVAPNSQYYALSQTQALSQCGGVDASVPRPFATDGNTAMVELGPFAHRLYQRSDITARMRLVVQKHNLEPHEAAVPMALTGRPVGQPNAAGLGAHIQRARIDARVSPGRASPYSYVFATGGISSDNVAAAAASGTHPGGARPLLIKTDNAGRFTNLLTRPAVGSGRPQHDALVGAYLDQYNARLVYPERGRVRSARTDDFAVAFETTKRSGSIASVLTPDLFQERNGTSCGVTDRSLPLMGLSAARHLLTHPTEPASYVCVSDTGLYEASGGGGYDTHSDNSVDTAVNFDNMLQSLLGMINAPGEADPTKISLDDTLVILNTEFGRTPGKQGMTGRNHYPQAYVTAFIGGPVTSSWKGVAGAIGRDGKAKDGAATPAENRMAALLALGIWPFAQEGFNVADTPSATSELAAAQSAMTK